MALKSVLITDNKTIIMTTDSISTASDNAMRQHHAKVRDCRSMTFVALGCAVVGLAFCWLPIVGMAHALAAVILGMMAYRHQSGRMALSTAIVGAVATAASIVLTIAEVHGIEVVNTYSAAPWI